ncbi:MAG: alanine racemase, partial [Acidimicrobiales bacterium]
MTIGHLRPAWAEVDLDALAHNVGLVRSLVAPARLCAVVKADGYGHGAVTVARAAVEAGASWLAVALPEEGMELRRAGIEAPVLVLSEPEPEAMAEAVGWGLTPTVYGAGGIAAAAAGARASGRSGVGVHLKIDTGMHRVGAHPDAALDLARAVEGAGPLRLEGLWTHLAVADEPGDPFTAEQLRRFDEVRDRLTEAGMV